MPLPPSAIDGLGKGVEKSDDNGDDGAPPPPEIGKGGGEKSDGIFGKARSLAEITNLSKLKK